MLRSRVAFAAFPTAAHFEQMRRDCRHAWRMIVCVPCLVEISDAGRRTWMTCIFAILPAVGETFAFDEPGGLRCEVVVLAIEAGQAPYGDRQDCVTLRVRRRTPSRSHFGSDWLPLRPRTPPARRLA